MRWEQASEENNERQRELPFPATTPTSAGDFARGEQSSTLSSLLLRFIVSKWVKTATESTGPESTTNASETIRVRPYTRRTGRRDGSVRGDVTDDAASVKCLVVDNDFELFTGDDIDHHHAELDDSTGHEDSRTCTNRSRPHSFKSSKRSGMLDGTWQRLWIVKVWPVIKSIGDMSFPDKAQERSFQREVSGTIIQILVADSSNGMPLSPEHSQARPL
jgi:hypothetical protein